MKRIIKKIVPKFIKNYIAKQIRARKLLIDIKNTITKFESNLDKSVSKEREKAILTDCNKYNVTPLEWYLFNFSKISEKEKEEFLPDHFKDLWTVGSNLEIYWELTDKFWFYNKNKEFFKRKAIQLDQNTSFEEFELFCKECDTVFIKPLSAAFGYNTFKYVYNVDDIKALYEKLIADKNSITYSSLTKYGFIVEELIRQDDHLGAFNKSSVNTVRIPSVLTAKGHYVLGCFFRTGRKGAVIDNAGGGGIFAALDEVTGIAITDGHDELGNTYTVHPDSGVAYKGFQMKDWKELLEITKRAHEGMRNHIYIAYDFAHTDKGWVMLEGNFGQFLGQFATQKGLKSKFRSMIFD